jgi:hypothetical protein
MGRQGVDMIRKPSNLQNSPDLSIGQFFRGLAFTAVAASTMPIHRAWSQPFEDVAGLCALAGPYCLTTLVVTGAVCQYLA